MRRPYLWLKLALFPLFRSIALCVPKDKSLWIFGAWYGEQYNDNTRALMEYVQSNCPAVRAVWIYRSRSARDALKRDAKLEAHHLLSLRGMYLQMRAGVAFVTHSLSADMNPGCVSSGTMVVNVWHGITLKKIMYGADDASSPRAALKRTVKKRIDRVDYVLASSRLIQKVMSESFELPMDRVWRTGYPRTDLVLRGGGSGRDHDANRLRILFAPSFRDHEKTHDYFQGYGCDIEELATTLDNANAVLEVRLHPMSKMPEEITRRMGSNPVFDMGSRAGPIWDILPLCDCVITDMSSIAIEFMILGRPVFFLDLGMTSEEQRGRPLVFNFADIPKELRLESWQHISRALSVVADGDECTDYWNSYREMRDRFLEYGLDGDACQNTVSMVRRVCLDR